jgi:hypothetical protein
LKVRIPVLADTLSDGGERFQLSVQYTGVKDAGQTLIPDTTTVFNGFAMIMDDGTGFMWDSNGNLLTPASSAVVPSGNLLADDDRPLTVNNLTVNEGSPYAVFTVGAKEDQYVKLAFDTGTATPGTDFTNTLEYWNGTQWTPYTADTFVKVPNDGDVTTGENANLLVRIAITNDTTPDNGETLKLKAFNTGGGSAVGTATITDDGSGTYFKTTATEPGVTPATPSALATPQTVTAATGTEVLPSSTPAPLLNDDRPLVVNNLSVNEGSSHAVFTVSAHEGQYVLLNLTASTATADIDYINYPQYWNGSEWKDYTPGSFVQVPGDGDGNANEAANLLVRILVLDDTTLDTGETFTLTATNTGGTSSTGTGTIKDDGSGLLFAIDDENTTLIDESAPVNGSAQLWTVANTPVANPLTQHLANDDRPVTVNDVTTTEDDPFATFTVEAREGQYVKLALASGSATSGMAVHGSPMSMAHLCKCPMTAMALQVK